MILRLFISRAPSAASPLLNYDPDSGLCVIQSPDGKFISGWMLDPEQAANVMSRGTLGGGN